MSRGTINLAVACAMLAVPAVAGTLPGSGVLLSLAPGQGRNPNSGLVEDAAGNLYGTAALGGAHAGGTFFRLAPPALPGGAWQFTALHDFHGTPDGNLPDSAPIMDPLGRFYGTTAYGGRGGGPAPGYGTVYRLAPGPNGTWKQDVIYSFGPPPDGSIPQARLYRRQDGVLLGTTTGGGAFGQGTVFMLRHPPHNTGTWVETILYSFAGGASDGAIPVAGLFMDGRGRLFGTTAAGGLGPAPGNGTVFMLSPIAGTGGYTESVLHFFAGGADGAAPFSQLITDRTGDLYGTTSAGGTSGGGTVWKLGEDGSGNPVETVIANLDATTGTECFSGLATDRRGNLYGTAYTGGLYNGGTVFIVEPPELAGGSWTPRPLHSFNGPNGAFSFATPILDPSGALYGTTSIGGSYDRGVVFGLAIK